MSESEPEIKVPEAPAEYTDRIKELEKQLAEAGQAIQQRNNMLINMANAMITESLKISEGNASIQVLARKAMEAINAAQQQGQNF